MSKEKILTKHSTGKRGVNINKEKYEVVKASILECLNTKEMTHTDLTRCVNQNLKGNFKGSIKWHVEMVKLDLEARHILERITDAKPHVYRKRTQRVDYI